MWRHIESMWGVAVENANAITAIATMVGALAAVVACVITIYNIKDTAKMVSEVVKSWKQSQNPSFCVERRGRLADDGKNFSHEDLFVGNLGRAPKSIRGISVKEYHVITAMKGWEIKTIVLPIWFYQYGSYSQQLVGRIFSAIGDNARERCFNFDVSMRTFLRKLGWGYSSETKVFVRVSYVDVFGKEQDEYYEVDSVGGHDLITQGTFEDYDKKSALLFKFPPIKLELEKIDLAKVFENWIVPEAPQKILNKEDVEKGDSNAMISAEKMTP